MNLQFDLKDICNDYPVGMFEQTSYYPYEHYHKEHELFYLESGSVTFIINHEEIELEAGNALFIQAETTHYLKKNNNNFHYYCMIFAENALGSSDDINRRLFANIKIYRLLSLSDEIINRMKKACELNNKTVFGKAFIYRAVLFDLITDIITTNQFISVGYNSSFLKAKKIASIEAVTQYIEDHYSEIISMDDLLELTNYSRSHFIRLFKQQKGMNITDYINKFRIDKCCDDLLYTEKNITQIAMENGFNTLQYFTKVFKDYMKTTPKQFQKLNNKIL